MRVTAAIAALAAVASASVVRQERQTVPALGGGPEVPEADRVCTKSGEKCAGVPGFEEVVFSSCCDNRLSCGVPTDIPDGEWGQFCISEENVDVDATLLANNGGDSTTTTAPGATTVPGGTTAPGGTTSADMGTGTTTTGPTLAPGETTTTSATDDDDTDAAGGVIGGSSSGSTPEPSDEDDGSVCFPAAATVELENGENVRMDEVSIGDVVKVGVNEYSRVFMFTHKMAGISHKFVNLKTASGAELALTKGHYLYANGALVAASTVNVGDVLNLGNGESSAVVSVGASAAVGLFNPQTAWSEIATPDHLHYTKGGKPGNFPDFDTYKLPHPVPFKSLYDPFGFSKNKSAEAKARGLKVEINNGRLAMLGIFGFLSEQTIPGSVPGLTGIVQPYSGEVMAPFSENMLSFGL